MPHLICGNGGSSDEGRDGGLCDHAVGSDAVRRGVEPEEGDGEREERSTYTEPYCSGSSSSEEQGGSGRLDPNPRHESLAPYVAVGFWKTFNMTEGETERDRKRNGEKRRRTRRAKRLQTIRSSSAEDREQSASSAYT
ncbi:hypothetical protein EYF80_043667 [Liparis tanakae]|uniref:Uncharacterized protein n=1 Tax=Liparis tanakae TaxID=230148 RepID=A0A4Z2FYP9_9TELE|nr:hypothetical protein EYF80_043667 [Liparis tanakae]